MLKLFVLLCVAVLVAMAQNLSDEEEWNNFKSTFNKVYQSPEEEARRFEIFKHNLDGIRVHNKKHATGEVSYSQGVNEFTDLTNEEFKQTHFGYNP